LPIFITRIPFATGNRHTKHYPTNFALYVPMYLYDEYEFMIRVQVQCTKHTEKRGDSYI